MPYIKDSDRLQFQTISNLHPKTAGELNYVLTSIAVQYLHDKGVSYSNINEIMGAFTCASLEFYRRAAVPYEDTKITENGDVY